MALNAGDDAEKQHHFYFAVGIKNRTGNLENNLSVSYKTKRATTK